MTKYLIHCNGKGRFVDIEPQETTADQYGEMQERFADEAGKPDDYASMIRLWPDQVCYGVFYSWGLAGPGGAWFDLIAMPDTMPGQIAAAKARIRRTRDVVSMSVTRIKELI